MLCGVFFCLLGVLVLFWCFVFFLGCVCFVFVFVVGLFGFLRVLDFFFWVCVVRCVGVVVCCWGLSCGFFWFCCWLLCWWLFLVSVVFSVCWLVVLCCFCASVVGVCFCFLWACVFGFVWFVICVVGFFRGFWFGCVRFGSLVWCVVLGVGVCFCWFLSGCVLGFGWCFWGGFLTLSCRFCGGFGFFLFRWFRFFFGFLFLGSGSVGFWDLWWFFGFGWRVVFVVFFGWCVVMWFVFAVGVGLFFVFFFCFWVFCVFFVVFLRSVLGLACAGFAFAFDLFLGRALARRVGVFLVFLLFGVSVSALVCWLVVVLVCGSGVLVRLLCWVCVVWCFVGGWWVVCFGWFWVFLVLGVVDGWCGGGFFLLVFFLGFCVFFVLCLVGVFLFGLVGFLAWVVCLDCFSCCGVGVGFAVVVLRWCVF